MNAKSLIKKGNQFSEKEKYEEAIISYTEAIKKEPNLVDGYIYRGSCYFKLRIHRHAIVDIKKALSISKDSSQKDTLSKILSQIESEIESAKKYFLVGAKYFNENQNELAIKEFSTAIQIDPFSLCLYLNRGKCYSKMQMYAESLRDYGVAIQLSDDVETTKTLCQLIYIVKIQAPEDFADAYFSQGNDNYKRGNYEKAISLYSRAIEDDPSVPNFYIMRAYSFLKLESYHNTIQDINTAILIEPMNDKYYKFHSMVNIRIEAYSEAIKDIKKAIALATNEEDRKSYEKFLGDINFRLGYKIGKGLF